MTYQTAKRHANKQLSKLTAGVYFEHVPLDYLYAAVGNAGYVVEPADEAPFMLCGHEGRATVPLAFYDVDAQRAADAARRLDGHGNPDAYQISSSIPDPRPRKAALCFSWYRMPSGRFEVVAYVS